MYPVSADRYEACSASRPKLTLSDASLISELESSDDLGFGLRVGFQGMLHMEIIQERLTREYDLDLITTAPSVVYRIQLNKSRTDPAQELMLHNPADYPDPSRIEQIEEPWIKAVIYTPDEYLGSILKPCSYTHLTLPPLTSV